MEQLTESLAAMPVAEQAALGFTTADFILECTYDGVPCNMDTYVLTILSFCQGHICRRGHFHQEPKHETTAIGDTRYAGT